MEKIKNIFFYAGATASDYERIQGKINETNRALVNAISGLASFLITLMFVLSYFIEGIGMNHTVYGLGSIISLICLFHHIHPLQKPILSLYQHLVVIYLVQLYLDI